MTNFDSVYWEIIGLKPEKLNSEGKNSDDPQEKDQWAIAREAALSRAHEIRKFEIELYWKRAAHFWFLQAAVFTAIGLSWRGLSEGLSSFIPVLLAALGSVTARAGYLSAKGSKFWQENWEYHIDMLENEFEGRLHKTAYVGKDGIASSVSGINSRLAMSFFVFWLLVLIITMSVALNISLDTFLLDDLQKALCQTPAKATLMAAIIIITLFVCFCRLPQKSGFRNSKGVSFTDSVPRRKEDGYIDVDKLPAVEALENKGKPFLIRREPKE